MLSVGAFIDNEFGESAVTVSSIITSQRDISPCRSTYEPCTLPQPLLPLLD